MKIHELPGDPGRQQKPKRVGRGEGSGHGKTSGYGHKGSKARSGRGKGYAGAFEGGQVPLARRLPKRGFKNPFRTEYEVVNLSSLEKAFSAGADITLEDLAKARLVRRNLAVKVLGNGKLSKALTVHAHAFSGAAKEAIEKAGGSCVTEGDAPSADDK
ncbi:MAG: 50S ribosomal protein L15 [Candidatus Sumerlaeia bacterium]|nr:50S ribosomal protein L15 [Candidatus Sumerlaeia bacterium]